MLGTGGGVGIKPADHWVAPLCGGNGCHREQHRIGHRAFDALHGVDLKSLAEQYAALSPHLRGCH
jgi:hypothetical protein